MRTKETRTTEELLAAERENLAKLEAKRDDLDKKIRACKANIEKYELIVNADRLKTISATLGQKGVSLDELMLAISNGDLTELQDKLDNTATDYTP